jgi:hypothetical protein
MDFFLLFQRIVKGKEFGFLAFLERWANGERGVNLATQKEEKSGFWPLSKTRHAFAIT